MTRARSYGFTLIEIMVAVAIFAVMSMLAWGALARSLSDAEMLTDRMDHLQAIQRSMRYLSSELTQAAPRPVRDELGDTFVPAVYSSLSGDFAIELTHGGWRNPAGLPRSTLQRTAYRIEEGQLIRYHWTVLDRTYANEPITTVMLDEIESLVFLFYDDNGQASEVWPPQGATGVSALRIRPRAVEVILTMADEGEISRLLEIAL
ncbi:MAG: type II secretion system minor pseudopilin GspJ [Woeseiaceae bacterium]